MSRRKAIASTARHAARGVGALTVILALSLLAVPGRAWASEVPWLAPREVADLLGESHFPYVVVPHGMTGVPGNVKFYSSLAEYSADTTPSPVVMYDIEAWAATPPLESLHPLRSMKTFAALARERGQVSILAPSLGLTRVTGCKRPGETKTHAYVRCGLAVKVGDYLLVQSQSLECDPPKFGAFIQAVAARRASGVLAELSVIQKTKECVSADTIQAAHDAAAPYATGFAMWARSDAVRPWADQSAILTELANRGMWL